MIDLKEGDNRAVLPQIPENTLCSVITDPPYGIDFMQAGWDKDVPPPELWRECLRVLKPGGYLIAFFSTRTYHNGATAIEKAGFQIRDMISWNYGEGFPKALDISKAIDKMKGAERQIINKRNRTYQDISGGAYGAANPKLDEERKQIEIFDTAPATEEALEWEGWKTALKPAFEPICLARKPFSTSVTKNVLQHGTGALNIDRCAVGNEKRYNTAAGNKPGETAYKMSEKGMPQNVAGNHVTGRHPANAIFDNSAGVELDKQSEALTNSPAALYFNNCNFSVGDIASFFYCPKAKQPERNCGLDTQKNIHPTVKPVQLMRHLVRLITPPNGRILDPFLGSGSTGIAAVLEGFSFTGIELDPSFMAIAQARINFASANKESFEKAIRSTKSKPQTGAADCQQQKLF